MIPGTEVAEIRTTVIFQRWIILGIFCLITLVSAYQWNNLIIIPQEVIQIFNSSMPESKASKHHMMDFFSVSYQIFYIIFMVPSSVLISCKGLRFSGIVAISLIFLGCWIKTLAVHLAQESGETSSFPVLVFGQVFCAISNSFVLAIPPFLSATWFGDREIALATSIGVLGNQLGIALGFFISPSVMAGFTGYDSLKSRLLYLHYSNSILATIILLVVFIFYKDQPRLAPNRAQALKRTEIEIKLPEEADHMLKMRKSSWTSLFKRIDFILLTLSYGLMVGVFYGISTLIDKILEAPFKDFPSGSGYVGTIIVISGIFGSVLCGIVLQKTGKYKLVNLVVYLLSLFGMVGFLLSVEYNSEISIFIMSGILGFFMTGYLPLGFEFAAEIAYPVNEDVSSGILNISAQIFGIVLVIVPRIIIESSNVLNANIFLTACMFLGIIMKLFIKERLLRTKA